MTRATDFKLESMPQHALVQGIRISEAHPASAELTREEVRVTQRPPDQGTLGDAPMPRDRPFPDPRLLVRAAYQRHSVARTFTTSFALCGAASMYHGAATASVRSELFAIGVAALLISGCILAVADRRLKSAVEAAVVPGREPDALSVIRRRADADLVAELERSAGVRVPGSF